MAPNVNPNPAYLEGANREARLKQMYQQVYLENYLNQSTDAYLRGVEEGLKGLNDEDKEAAYKSGQRHEGRHGVISVIKCVFDIAKGRGAYLSDTFASELSKYKFHNFTSSQTIGDYELSEEARQEFVQFIKYHDRMNRFEENIEIATKAFDEYKGVQRMLTSDYLRYKITVEKANPQSRKIKTNPLDLISEYI